MLPITALDNDEDSQPLMNRIEDKYLLPRRCLGKATDVLRAHLGQGDIDTSARYNQNTTIYLDNKDLVSFRDALDRAKPRFKARIRHYAPNDTGPENVSYLELKIAADKDKSQKIRIRIPRADTEALSEGGELKASEYLMDINKDISKEKLWNRIAIINTLISKYGLKKHLEVTYERRAFSDNKIRVTIDDGIKFKAYRSIEPAVKTQIMNSDNWLKKVQQISQLATGEWVILEVKHEDDIPGWLKTMLKDCDAEQVKASKYACAVTKQILTGSEGPILPSDSISKLPEHEGDMSKSEQPLKRRTLRHLMGKDEDHPGGVQDFMHMATGGLVPWSKTPAAPEPPPAPSPTPAPKGSDYSAIGNVSIGGANTVKAQPPMVAQQPAPAPNPMKDWRPKHDEAKGMIHMHHDLHGVITIKKHPRAMLRREFPYMAVHNGKSIGRWKTPEEAREGVSNYAASLGRKAHNPQQNIDPMKPFILKDEAPPVNAGAAQQITNSFNGATGAAGVSQGLSNLTSAVGSLFGKSERLRMYLKKADEAAPGMQKVPSPSEPLSYLDQYSNASRAMLANEVKTHDQAVKQIKDHTPEKDKSTELAKLDRKMNYFKEAVQVADHVRKAKESPEAPPMSMNEDNEKLKKDHIVSFSLPAGHTSPNKGDNVGPAYAMVNSKSWKKALSDSADNWASAERDDFVPRMNEMLKKYKPDQKIRLHDSGDFYSQPYVDKWHEIAKQNPDKKFYTYTKALDLNLKKLQNLPNMHVIQSVGGKYDSKVNIDEPHSYIFPDKDTLHANGYEDASESDAPAARNSNKVGLVVHGAESPTKKSMDEHTQWLPDAYKFDQPDAVHQADHASRKHPHLKLMFNALKREGNG